MKILSKKAMLGCGMFLISGLIFTPFHDFVPTAQAEEALQTEETGIFAQSNEASYEVDGLGYSTNVVRQRLGEFDASCPILDPEYLQTSAVRVKTTLNSSLVDFVEGNTFVELSE